MKIDVNVSDNKKVRNKIRKDNREFFDDYKNGNNRENRLSIHELPDDKIKTEDIDRLQNFARRYRIKNLLLFLVFTFFTVLGFAIIKSDFTGLDFEFFVLSGFSLCFVLLDMHLLKSALTSSLDNVQIISYGYIRNLRSSMSSSDNRRVKNRNYYADVDFPKLDKYLYGARCTYDYYTVLDIESPVFLVSFDGKKVHVIPSSLNNN